MTVAEAYMSSTSDSENNYGYADKCIFALRIANKNHDTIEFEKEFEEDVVDKNLLPVKVITTCEFNMEVKYDDIVEIYENVSFRRKDGGVQ